MDAIIERTSNWLLWLAIAAAAITATFVMASPAHAGNCGQFYAVKQQVVYAQPVYAAPIYYQAGVGIEQDALAAKVARIVIGQLRTELRAPVQAQQQTARQSAMAQHCGKCHSGATPKAGIVYDGTTSLDCHNVTAALRAIAIDHMPKNAKLTPDQKGLLMQELLDLEADRPQRNEGALPPPPQDDGGLK